jgi:ribonuclease III
LSATESLEERLGYRFVNPALLEQALTHRSFGAGHNERLEFLGDGVLGCAIAEALYRRFPQAQEGSLTRLRASLVREETLAQVAAEIGLVASLRWDAAGSPAPRPSVLADALEALVGAAFMDGGYPAAQAVVASCFDAHLGQLDPAQTGKDAKTQLQERLQGQGKPLPEYRVVSTQGAAHRRSFEVECAVAHAGLATRGTGTSRQRAEQEAAAAMLELLP